MKFMCKEPNCGWMYETFLGLSGHYSYKHKQKLQSTKIEKQKYCVQRRDSDGDIREEESTKKVYACSICSREFISSIWEKHNVSESTTE